MAYAAPLGFALMVGLTGLGCAANRSARFPWPAGVLLGAFLLWAAASMLWSPVHPRMGARSLLSAIEQATTAEVAVLAILSLWLVRAASGLDPHRARLCVAALRWSLCGLALMLILDSAARGEIYRWLAASVQKTAVPPDLAKVYAARGGYVLAVLIWPLLPALSGRQATLFAALTACGAASVTVFLRQDAPLLALLAGAAAYGLIRIAGRLGLAVLAVVAGAFWLGMPWAMLALRRAYDFHRLQGSIPASWSAPLRIWIFAADRIAQKPWRGWGMDASRAFLGDIPLHTHNWPSQVWLELGLPGILITLACWIGLVRAMARLPTRSQMASAAATAAAYQAIGAVSFGLWQTWWLGVGVLAAVGVIVANSAAPIRRNPPT